MFTNFIKIALRNIARHKVFSFINIFGLALGLASAIIILISMDNELSYDNFHTKKDRLYEVWNREKNGGRLQCWSTTCSPMGPTIKEDVPEIKNVARKAWDFSSLFTYKDKPLYAFGTGVDPAFLTMFTFPLVKGDPKTALSQVNNILITESLAKKIFGNEDPMNKTILFDNRDALTVTGVLKDIPKNSSFEFEYLLPWSYIEKTHKDYPYWTSNSIQTYVELQPTASVETVNSKIKNEVIKHATDGSTTELFLHAMKNWRLHSQFVNGKMEGGAIVYVRITAIIAIFILLIACINFMNLSTARSEKRAREIGIKKVVGAMRSQIIIQFLFESLLVTVIAFALSLVLVQLLLPWFNKLTNKQLEIDYLNPFFWAWAIIIILFTGLFAGSYPALYLSSFQPVKVLKSAISHSRSSITPRKILVVSQFVFSIGLIICTIITVQQLQCAQDRYCGYNKDALINIDMNGTLQKNYPIVKNELLSSGIATSVCLTDRSITSSGRNSWGFIWDGAPVDNHILFDNMTVKDGFVATMQLKLVQGRDINVDTYPTDTSAFLINESAAKIMGFKDPIGQIVTSDSQQFHIVGVFKDFIWGSPFYATQPMIIMGDAFTNPESEGMINIRFNAVHTVKDNLMKTESLFKKYNPSYPFNYRFVEDSYAKKFNGEQTVSKLAAIAALLAIIISCLGLFGLAAFTAEQRKKEISVRRVLGASVQDIVTLLAKEFLILVLLAAVIAFPVAWWAMHNWLQSYEYRINIGAGVFIISGFTAMCIALLTVSFQAIKAAKSNPVKNLRTE